ncbi:MAG: hypothetical protein WBV06_04675 [Acidimicrobiia bacterium]|jgi:hypothetical protein
MHVWHIIAGVYTAGLLFAMALIRVASPPCTDDVQTMDDENEAVSLSGEYEEIVDTDGNPIDAPTHRGPGSTTYDSRPGARRHRLSERRKADSTR